MKVIEVNGKVVSEDELEELKKDKSIKLKQNFSESSSDRIVYRKLEKFLS
jgi:hypothetical protein